MLAINRTCNFNFILRNLLKKKHGCKIKVFTADSTSIVINKWEVTQDVLILNQEFNYGYIFFLATNQMAGKRGQEWIGAHNCRKTGCKTKCADQVESYLREAGIANFCERIVHRDLSHGLGYKVKSKQLLSIINKD